MSTGYTKPKGHELQEDLKMIAEVPDRITEFKQVRLKEILIYIDREEQDRLKIINHLLIHQPESTFEHWAKNVRSVFTLNELKELKGFIINHLNSINGKESTKDQEQPEIISQVFRNGGFEIFNHLDKHFTALNNVPTVKYTVLYHFLEGKKIYPNKTKFMMFVRSYCGNSLGGKKFSKIESDYKTDPNFTDNKPELTSLYNVHFKTSKD